MDLYVRRIAFVSGRDAEGPTVGLALFDQNVAKRTKLLVSRRPCG